MMDRATDEVRSWFGDDEAGRRRQQDERYNVREDYGRRDLRDDYGRRDWTRNRGYGRDDSTDYDRDRALGRGPSYGTERGYAEGEDIGRTSRAYSSPGRTWSESPRDVDRPDWGWGGSERSQRYGRDRSGPSRTEQWGTPRDWETSGRDDRWVTGGYSSTLLAWSEPGPYTGRGPKGYQRSDDRIREDVCDRLTRHGRLDATDIQIQVRNGEVTLDGIVDTREAKRMAEDVAESVDGVRDVINHLKTHRTEEVITAGRKKENV